MTKQPQKNSQTCIVFAEAKTECEKKLVNYFKEVLSRDGLKMRDEVFKMIEHYWMKLHPIPGNPQTQLFQYGDVHEESTVLCDVNGCREEAGCQSGHGAQVRQLRGYTLR